VAHIFPVATRQPGVLDNFSNPKTVEATAAGKHYFVVTVIAQADLDDPTVSFDLRMYIRRPDLSWPALANPFERIDFVGKLNGGKNGSTATPAPGFSLSGDEVAGKQVAFRLAVNGRAFDMGLDATQI